MWFTNRENYLYLYNLINSCGTFSSNGLKSEYSDKRTSSEIAVVLAFCLISKAETDILRNSKTISDTSVQHPLTTYIYRLEIRQGRWSFCRRVLSVDKRGSGFFLTSQTKWGGLQWNLCEKVGLFARRGSQKCPLQLYPFLMPTHTQFFTLQVSPEVWGV